jgi:hypothetical protein
MCGLMPARAHCPAKLVTLLISLLPAADAVTLDKIKSSQAHHCELCHCGWCSVENCLIVGKGLIVDADASEGKWCMCASGVAIGLCCAARSDQGRPAKV